MFSKSSILFSALAVLSAISQAQAHGMIQQIQGSNGVTANGFGVQKTSDTSQASVAVIKGNTGCGTINGKAIDTAAELEAAISAGLPETNADGTLDMVWFQQNSGADGGGPGTAAIDTTGTANSFNSLTITKNFGDGGQNSANPMTVQVAAGTVCTGGSTGNACVAKVTNPAGPFGSCFAFTTPDSKAAAGGGAAAAPAGGNAAATTTAAAADTAATTTADAAPAATTTAAAASGGSASTGAGAAAGTTTGKKHTGKHRKGKGAAAAAAAAAKAKTNNAIAKAPCPDDQKTKRMERRHARDFRA